MMKVLDILDESITDGEGIRTVIFFAGCEHYCPGCHNPASWRKDQGKDMTVKDIVSYLSEHPYTNVTLSGGDPFLQSEEVSELAAAIKDMGKTIWCYTGYRIEEIISSSKPSFHKLLESCDVLVDGPFIEAEKDLSLPFRGSRNQKIIHNPSKLISDQKKVSI